MDPETLSQKARKQIFHRASLMLALQFHAAQVIVAKRAEMTGKTAEMADKLIADASLMIAERIVDIAERRRILA